MRFTSAALTALLSLSFAACGESDNASSDSNNCEGAKCDAAGDDGRDEFEQRSYCVGVRGNGELITAHFASLARIIEHYGLTSGVSGGSSASITSFLLESIQMHPAVTTCGDVPCTDEQAANRAALLLKSLQGYLTVLAGTPEAAAITQLAPLAKTLADQDLEALAKSDPEAARAAFEDLLTSSDLRELINPELLELLQTSPDPAFHVQDVAGALAAAASFDAGDPTILVRPGLIDFTALAEKVGRIGSFYAGYGDYDADGFEAFMAGCADAGRGLNWAELAALPVDDAGTRCGDAFNTLATRWRDDFIANEDVYVSRIDDQVGDVLPALISTSVITGDSAQRWAKARDQYFAAEEFAIDMDFDEIRFGYFGAKEDLDQVGRNAQGFDDLKSSKFMSLGQASWRRALSYSPAEPGLARALELPDTENISAGGWSDLHPSLVLRNMGCDNVMYVTRTDVDLGGFADSVAHLLGMSDEVGAELYDLQRDSSITRSVAEADAVWCTNWNDIPATDVAAVSADGYGAALVTRDPTFTEGRQAYENIDPDLSAVGCTVQ